MTRIFILLRRLGLGLALSLCTLLAVAQDSSADATAEAVEGALAEELSFDEFPPPGAEESLAEDEQGSQDIENPFGFRAMLEHGDFVSKGTLAVLAIMSAATWYILIVKLIEQGKLRRDARSADRKFWTAGSIHEGLGKLRKGGAIWFIVDRGLRADAHHEGTLVEQIDRSTWITMSINRAVEAINSNLSSGLAVLATVGSTAPFVGLFGTVWGIYHALVKIGDSGQASIDQVAGPVGEALIMTAIGLAVAVPAVLGYNWLVRRNKGVLELVRNFAADLHSVLLSGSRIGDAAGKGTPPQA